MWVTVFTLLSATVLVPLIECHPWLSTTYLDIFTIQLNLKQLAVVKYTPKNVTIFPVSHYKKPYCNQ
jgi:hypothetical protein